MERSMRPRSRTDNKGMSPKVIEPTTKSPDGLNLKDRAELEKFNTLRRASAMAARERNLKADDPRLPGVTERKAADKKEAKRIYNLMFGEDMPEKKMSGGKMKKPVAMKSGGKMPMVKKDGKSVPSFAADGVGKMMYGGKMPEKMSYGGKTPKKMGMGGGMGKCRGMGAATRGGNFKMG